MKPHDFPRQKSGKRFFVCERSGQFVVYDADGLHLCHCDDKRVAAMIAASLETVAAEHDAAMSPEIGPHDE